MAGGDYNGITKACDIINFLKGGQPMPQQSHSMLKSKHLEHSSEE